MVEVQWKPSGSLAEAHRKRRRWRKLLSGDRTSHLNMVRTSVYTQCKAHSQPLQSLYSKSAHRDISSSLLYNKYQLYYTRADSSVVRASPRIGKVLGSNPRLVILFHSVTSGNSNRSQVTVQAKRVAPKGPLTST